MNGTCNPYLSLYNIRNKQEVVNTKQYLEKFDQLESHVIKIKGINAFCGDFGMVIKHDGMMSDNVIVRVQLNTAMI